MEDRVHDAVLEVYSQHGWAGFTLEAVARAAKVGREALYRRWSTKAELLGAAVMAGSPTLERIDTGSTAGDLAELARHFLASYREPLGVVGLRMVLDARSNPELAEQLGRMLAGRRSAEAQRVVRRAVGRGDLPADVPVVLLLEVLTGATLTHVLYGGNATQEADERHVRRLVDLLLRTT